MLNKIKNRRRNARKRQSVSKEDRPDFVAHLQKIYDQGQKERKDKEKRSDKRFYNLPNVYTFESEDDMSEPEVEDFLRRRRSSFLGLERRNSQNDDMILANRNRRLDNAKNLFETVDLDPDYNGTSESEDDLDHQVTYKVNDKSIKSNDVESRLDSVLNAFSRASIGQKGKDRRSRTRISRVSVTNRSGSKIRPSFMSSTQAYKSRMPCRRVSITKSAENTPENSDGEGKYEEKRKKNF